VERQQVIVYIVYVDADDREAKVPATAPKGSQMKTELIAGDGETNAVQNRVALGMDFVASISDTFFQGVRTGMENLQQQLDFSFALSRLDSKRMLIKEIEDRCREYGKACRSAKSPLDKALANAGVRSCASNLKELLAEVMEAQQDDEQVNLIVTELITGITGEEPTMPVKKTTKKPRR
jgi:hypothetical protein